MSGNPENEKLLNYLVVLDKPGRKFQSEGDTRWGGLIMPAPGENPGKTADGLKIVLFGSWDGGYVMLETLKALETRFPDKLNLIGFVTDDPLNPDAKISVKKRIWGFLQQHERVIDETTIIESALGYGIPVFNGEIKTDAFRRLLKEWNTDAILVCIFGQIIDRQIIDLPPYGIYNFHPSDLLNKHGAGPAPYEDLAARRAETSVWSVHHVSEEIDSGQVVGQSPPMCVLNMQGILPSDPFIVYNKFMEGLGPTAVILVDELHRRWIRNEVGFIDCLDIPAVFPEEIRKSLLLPISQDAPFNIFLRPDPLSFV